MRNTLKAAALTGMVGGLLLVGGGTAHADRIVDTEIPPPAGSPCSDLPNAFVEEGGRVGADLTIKCFE